MAAAAILKSRKIAISQQRFERSPRNLARWLILTLDCAECQNVEILKIHDCAGGRHSDKKIGKVASLTDCYYPVHFLYFRQ